MPLGDILTAPGVHPFVEIAVGDVEVAVGQGQYNVAHYDVYPEATYSGNDPLFDDVTCYVHEITTHVGRQRTIDAFETGTATVTVNNETGWADYPSTVPNILELRPGRMIRIGARFDDDVPGAPPSVVFWRGWIDRTAPAFDAEASDLVTIDCIDAKGEVGRAEAPTLAVPVGGGETVTSRMQRLANLVAWPTARRQFDYSGITLIEARLGGRIVGQLDEAAASAGGAVFGDVTGDLVYRDRDWLSFSGTEPDFRIGNTSIDNVCPNSWEVSFDRADYSTRILFGRPGEEALTLDDSTLNLQRFGVETYTMTLGSQYTETMRELARRTLRVRSFNNAPRIAAVNVDAAQPNVPSLLAAASPYMPSLYNCWHVEDEVIRFGRLMFCTGVDHTITPESWTARLALDDAAPYLQNSNARYDDGEALYNRGRYAAVV